MVLAIEALVAAVLGHKVTGMGQTEGQQAYVAGWNTYNAHFFTQTNHPHSIYCHLGYSLDTVNAE